MYGQNNDYAVLTVDGYEYYANLQEVVVYATGPNNSREYVDTFSSSSGVSGIDFSTGSMGGSLSISSELVGNLQSITTSSGYTSSSGGTNSDDGSYDEMGDEDVFGNDYFGDNFFGDDYFGDDSYYEETNYNTVTYTRPTTNVCGIECNSDQILNLEICECEDEIDWFLDLDLDGYHGDFQKAVNSPGDDWKKGISNGEDCDDNNEFIQKINKCGVCDSQYAPDFCCPKGQIPDGTGGCKPDPCLNKDLRHKKIPDNIKQKINSRVETNPYPPHGEIRSFYLQTIEDGYGDINLDRYDLEITDLPNGYTPQQLFEEIRKNFSQLITGGDTPGMGVELRPYSGEDAITWTSDDPVGTAMDFANIIDTSTVICTEYSYNEMTWTFTTYSSFKNAGHFVSGHRQFGLEVNDSGGYSFYLRGADRLGGWLDVIGNNLPPGEDFLFKNAADSTWKNLMVDLQKFIRDKPGANAIYFDKNKNNYGNRHEYNKDDCPE